MSNVRSKVDHPSPAQPSPSPSLRQNTKLADRVSITPLAAVVSTIIEPGESRTVSNQTTNDDDDGQRDEEQEQEKSGPSRSGGLN
ncbi:hypothetical protein FRC18_008334 [Serendipita sp. 400]|nr:hypothetical protein FRC18_008334 [Serendipita sp. 400]